MGFIVTTWRDKAGGKALAEIPLGTGDAFDADYALASVATSARTWSGRGDCVGPRSGERSYEGGRSL